MISGLASANSVKLVDGQALFYNNGNAVFATVDNDDNTYFTNVIVVDNVAFVGGDGGLFSYDINTAQLIESWPGGGAAGQVTSISYSNTLKLLAVGYEEDIELMNCKNLNNVVSVGWIFTGYMPMDTEFKGSVLYTDMYNYDCTNPTKPRCVNPGAKIFIYDNVGTWAAETIDVEYSTNIIGFGWKGCEPIVGDWNGDGFKEHGLYNRNGNNFIIPTYDEPGFKVIGLGWAGVTPVIGDFDGDGDDDVGVYDNHGTWALSTDKGVTIVGFGWTGVEPVVGDWNGDGTDEVGVYNRAGNNWLVRLDNTNLRVIGLGWPGVKTLVGNIDTDKQDEVIVYDPASAVFVSNDGYEKVFGPKNSQPILGDVDFNKIMEIGCIKPDGTVQYNVAKTYTHELVKWPKSTAIAV